MNDDDVRYTREVQAAMERVAGEANRWRARADALATALRAEWREGHEQVCVTPWALDDRDPARLEAVCDEHPDSCGYRKPAALREYDEEAGR